MVFKQYSKYYRQQNIQSNNDEADITNGSLFFLTSCSMCMIVICLSFKHVMKFPSFLLPHLLYGSRHLYYNIKVCGLLFPKIVFIAYNLLVTCKECIY